ncbi:MAG: RNA methyltransferase [Clostridia bacterium]|nr:RNA methyltransferase [Clostridia bacterium]
MKTLPIDFENRMKNLLGDEFESYKNSLEEEPVRSFRINTNKISLEDFNKIDVFNTEKIPYSPTGFYFDYEKIGNHPYHHAGMIYVQEPGAMAPAECMELEDDWVILDMCSAPGGKSTQLRNKLGEKGILVSNEIIPSRCKILTSNIERLGLKNTITTCMDSGRLARLYPETFDLIMVDAPCSGEGMFRKEQIAIDEWSKENVEKCAIRQMEILENSSKCLKNGGYIVYATCTFSLEENEMLIDAFLNSHPEFELLRVNEEVEKNTSDGIFFDGCRCENIHYTRRVYPHKNKGEGQFMALLHNTDPERQTELKKSKSRNLKIDETVFDFLDSVLTTYDKDSVKMNNDTPIYFTGDFDTTKATVYMKGVTIGEIKKNYIQPHHQFFMAMGESFKRKIELSVDSEEIKKYLHGEEFSTTCENGWAVVTINGCSLGGVKVVNGRAKNHYPKGLRLK